MKYKNEKKCLKNISMMIDMVNEAENILINKNKDIDEIGELLDHYWKIKKKLSNTITLDKIEDIYNKAKKAGAIGGKLLGAGGGGYFLFYVPTFKKLDLINSLENKGLKIDTFTFDKVGLRSWITKERN